MVSPTKYLLDTNVLISMLRGNKTVRDNIVRVSLDNCCVSEISIAELFYGAAKSGREKNFKDVENIIKMFDIIPIYNSLKLYGQIKSDLEKIGQRIDEFDLLIGATAVENGCVMVSANEKHFARIPSITLENLESNVSNGNSCAPI